MDVETTMFFPDDDVWRRLMRKTTKTRGPDHTHMFESIEAFRRVLKDLSDKHREKFFKEGQRDQFVKWLESISPRA